MAERTEQNPIRVAVVGLGWAGREIWLPKLRLAPDRFEIVAVVDPSPDALAAVGGDVATMTSADDLDPASIDLAIVVVPNHLHTDTAVALLRRGITVFVEKPVCLTSEEAGRLAAAEAAGKAALLAGSAARYRADVEALRNLVAELGPIRHVDVSWVRSAGVPKSTGWFTKRELAGGGALVDLGWHLLDTVVPMLGDRPFLQVVGSVSGDFVNAESREAAWREEKAGRDGDVEDTARGFLVTEDGISLLLRASWASHEPRDITTIRVEGTAGSATLRCTFGFSPNRLEGSSLMLTKDGATLTVPVGEQIGCEYQRQLEEVSDLLGDPAVRGVAVAEATRIIAVIERLYESAHAGRARPAAAEIPVPVPG